MDTPTLQATTRTVIGKQVKQLRTNGELPGIVYGNGVENQIISLKETDFARIFKHAGTSTLVNLVVDDAKPVKVLLHEPQLHPIKPALVHADFYVVKMTEKLQTEIPLHFIGEAEAVTVLDGTLNTPLDSLNVECFPDKLVSAIEVDLGALKTFDDVIRIGDITLPEGIEVLDDGEEVIATITPPRSEEELAELDEAVDGAALDAAAVEGVDVTTEKKEDEETAAE